MFGLSAKERLAKLQGKVDKSSSSKSSTSSSKTGKAGSTTKTTKTSTKTTKTVKGDKEVKTTTETEETVKVTETGTDGEEKIIKDETKKTTASSGDEKKTNQKSVKELEDIKANKESKESSQSRDSIEKDATMDETRLSIQHRVDGNESEVDLDALMGENMQDAEKLDKEHEEIKLKRKASDKTCDDEEKKAKLADDSEQVIETESGANDKDSKSKDKVEETTVQEEPGNIEEVDMEIIEEIPLSAETSGKETEKSPQKSHPEKSEGGGSEIVVIADVNTEETGESEISLSLAANDTGDKVQVMGAKTDLSEEQVIISANIETGDGSKGTKPAADEMVVTASVDTKSSVNAADPIEKQLTSPANVDTEADVKTKISSDGVEETISKPVSTDAKEFSEEKKEEATEAGVTFTADISTEESREPKEAEPTIKREDDIDPKEKSATTTNEEAMEAGVTFTADISTEESKEPKEAEPIIEREDDIDPKEKSATTTKEEVTEIEASESKGESESAEAKVEKDARAEDSIDSKREEVQKDIKAKEGEQKLNKDTDPEAAKETPASATKREESMTEAKESEDKVEVVEMKEEVKSDVQAKDTTYSKQEDVHMDVKTIEGEITLKTDRETEISTTATRVEEDETDVKKSENEAQMVEKEEVKTDVQGKNIADSREDEVEMDSKSKKEEQTVKVKVDTERVEEISAIVIQEDESKGETKKSESKSGIIESKEKAETDIQIIDIASSKAGDDVHLDLEISADVAVEESTDVCVAQKVKEAKQKDTEEEITKEDTIQAEQRVPMMEVPASVQVEESGTETDMEVSTILKQVTVSDVKPPEAKAEPVQQRVVEAKRARVAPVKKVQQDTSKTMETNEVVHSQTSAEPAIHSFEYKAIPESFYNKLFHGSGMGTLSTEDVEVEVDVPMDNEEVSQDGRSSAASSRSSAKIVTKKVCVTPIMQEVQAKPCAKTPAIHSVRIQAKELTDDFRMMQRLLGGMPAYSGQFATYQTGGMPQVQDTYSQQDPGTSNQALLMIRQKRMETTPNTGGPAGSHVARFTYAAPPQQRAGIFEPKKVQSVEYAVFDPSKPAKPANFGGQSPQPRNFRSDQTGVTQQTTVISGYEDIGKKGLQKDTYNKPKPWQESRARGVEAVGVYRIAERDLPPPANQRHTTIPDSGRQNLQKLTTISRYTPPGGATKQSYQSQSADEFGREAFQKPTTVTTQAPPGGTTKESYQQPPGIAAYADL